MIWLGCLEVARILLSIRVIFTSFFMDLLKNLLMNNYNHPKKSSARAREKFVAKNQEIFQGLREIKSEVKEVKKFLNGDKKEEIEKLLRTIFLTMNKPMVFGKKKTRRDET